MSVLIQSSLVPPLEVIKGMYMGDETQTICIVTVLRTVTWCNQVIKPYYQKCFFTLHI